MPCFSVVHAFLFAQSVIESIGQALCNHCRENTHRAKMFSTHEVIHMSKCAKDSQKKCPVHSEPFIMFNNAQKSMLCVTCFRDTPQETRMHCVDIETAYTQGSKKLDRAVMSVCEMQNSVREGLLMFKTLLEDLRRNMDMERHTINTFCQGLQEAIAKTHSNMIMEVQRQYESKERTFRNQIVNLGTMLPVIQLHLLLCQSFTNIANKYQFLDLAYPMIDRLSALAQITQPQRPVQSSHIRTNFRSEFAQSLEPWIGKSPRHLAQHITPPSAAPGQTDAGPPQQQQPGTGIPAQQQHAPSKRQHTALRTKAMEGEGPFSNHCRSFDTQIKDLSQQLTLIKERLGDLHRDVAVLRKAQTPPLITRYQHITGDCALLEEQLERHQVELERLKKVFDTLWEEQLCRIHVEKDIFQSQMNEIVSLRSEVKHLSTVAQQLEPYIKSLATTGMQQHQQQQQQQAMQHQVEQHKQIENQQVQELTLHSQQLQSLLDHINMLQLDNKFQTQGVTSPIGGGGGGAVLVGENILYMKGKGPGEPRSRPRTPSQSPGTTVTAMLDASGNVILYDTNQRVQQLSSSDKRGVISQIMEKVRTKEERKKSPEDRERSGSGQRERSKSDGRADIIRTKATIEDIRHVDKQPVGVAKSKGKKEQRYGTRDGKVSSIYHTISGRVLGTKQDQQQQQQAIADIEASRLPPPPPPCRKAPRQDPNADIRERLEIHLKEKLHEIIQRTNVAKRAEKSLSLDAQALDDYQRMSDAILVSPEERKSTRVLVHRDSQGRKAGGSTSTSPHRRDDQRERSRESSREKKDRDLSRERDRSREGRERSSERRERREKRHSGSGRGSYPGEADEIFYPGQVAKKQASCESLALSTLSVNSRRSSTDLGDGKTLVLVIGGSTKSKQKHVQKQRSWETFPPKRRSVTGTWDVDLFGGRFYRSGDHFDVRPSSAQDGRRSHRSRSRERDMVEGTLRKADSFEGHEEAVRTLVAAVHQTRSQQQQQQQQQYKLKKTRSGGHVSN